MIEAEPDLLQAFQRQVRARVTVAYAADIERLADRLEDRHARIGRTRIAQQTGIRSAWRRGRARDRRLPAAASSVATGSGSNAAAPNYRGAAADAGRRRHPPPRPTVPHTSSPAAHRSRPPGQG